MDKIQALLLTLSKVCNGTCLYSIIKTTFDLALECSRGLTDSYGEERMRLSKYGL